jgi:hypothetical protein
MSFALTTAQILAGTKTVTRRTGWLKLKPGDLIRPVKKCMGLRLGEKIEPLRGPLRVVSVRREPLDAMVADVDYGFAEVEAEGFAEHPVFRWPSEFINFFCSTHGCKPDSIVTRIHFEYQASDACEHPVTEASKCK